MMSIIYRPAHKDDLDAGAAVVQRAMNELRPRHCLAEMPSPPPIQFPAFCLDRDPEGLWVAEADGSIIGWSFSWRHQTFSFLSQLDVVPEAQGKGVGQALLNNTARWARQQGMLDRALITFAFNSHSIGLYIRNGFHARVPLYLIGAPAGSSCGGSRPLPPDRCMVLPSIARRALRKFLGMNYVEPERTA